MSRPLPSQPVVIIGAARSGTNMLRDALCSLDGVGTWPCDEINPIWRHGNLGVPHDEFDRGHARARVVTFIRERFRRQARKLSSTFIVEKTCANAMRVGFVHEVVPEARFIHIHRDGMDAVPSAMKRWRAPFELGYTLQKVRFVPASDLFYFGGRFLLARLRRLVRRDRRLGSWGPRFKGMDSLPADTPLLQVCAKQWARSVGLARTQLSELPEDQVLQLTYEDFVADPAAGMQRLATWLGGDWSEADLRASVASVRAGSVGRGRAKLSAEEQELIHATASEAGVADRAPLAPPEA